MFPVLLLSCIALLFAGTDVFEVMVFELPKPCADINPPNVELFVTCKLLAVMLVPIIFPLELMVPEEVTDPIKLIPFS